MCFLCGSSIYGVRFVVCDVRTRFQCLCVIKSSLHVVLMELRMKPSLCGNVLTVQMSLDSLVQKRQNTTLAGDEGHVSTHDSHLECQCTWTVYNLIFSALGRLTSVLPETERRARTAICTLAALRYKNIVDVRTDMAICCCVKL
ncbi:unnamed protein product [Ostreobium quekettii]|uniref:Uncharacterized protein n=1 Tax=Ostreobium quekettii TaxID=121088 RepID=A0A8S1IVY0_9CHLO|nr:unnamed protein product [Ostreobium quekettii]